MIPTVTHEAMLAFVANLPKREITESGRPYLDRYYLGGRMTERHAEFWPEDNRPTPNPTDAPTVLIHRIHSPDPQRHPHNHPWRFTSSVLCGGFEEKRQGSKFEGPRTLRHIEGRTYQVEPNEYHKIVELLTANVWTMVTIARRVQSWGFLVAEEHVPWRAYLEMEKAHKDALNGLLLASRRTHGEE